MSRGGIRGSAGIVPILLFALAGCGGGGGGSASGAATFSVSGTLSGYAGSGLVLRLRSNGPTLAVSPGSGTFSFSSISSGSNYLISVATEPSAPAQTCTVTSGSGTVNANITNVQVSCATHAFTVSGGVALSGGATSLGVGLVLQNNGGDDLPVSTSNFTFGTPVADGSPYNVTVFTHPAGQTCTPSSNIGTVAGANVTNVLVTCANNPTPLPSMFTIGGSISGLKGSGLVLRNNGGDNLALNPASAITTFTFNTAIPMGGSYNVTILPQEQPVGQTCMVANGSGVNVIANITNVQVSCADIPTFTIGGLVSGLAPTGTGLVLQNNLGDNLPIGGNGAFSFVTKLASGSAYSVSILAQPTAHTCTFTGGGSGTVLGANVTTVAVSCVPRTFTISGTVSGLIPGRLLVLQNNLADNRSISANGVFTFNTAVASGSLYSVTVLTDPTGQTCTVANGSGTVTSAPITNVQVSCVTNSYTIGGTVSGLSGTGLVLQNNLGNNLSIGADGAFAFTTPILSGNAYSVTVLTQPTAPVQTCTVVSGSGTVAGADVANVQVNCANDPTYNIGGSVSGLTGAAGLVLQNNLGDNLSIGADGAFIFAIPLLTGLPYSVTVLTQPANRTCTVASGSGTVTNVNITVQVNCVTNSFSIGGSVSGLTGAGLVLQNNGTDNLPRGADGAFTFATLIANGNPYSVAVLTQPTGQTCTVTGGGSGTVMSMNVGTVLVNCVTNTYTISGSVSELITGRLLILQNNGADNLSMTSNGAFMFNTAIASGLPYSVTVLTQPIGQTCSVANGSGTVAGTITNVQVTCTTNTYTISGNVTGPLIGTAFPVGTPLVLKNNGADDIFPTGYGPFSFPTPVPSGAAYNVTVFQQPSHSQPPTTWTCVPIRATGVAGAANVTDVQISCVDNTAAVPTGSPMSVTRSYHTATLANGKVLIAGGSATGNPSDPAPLSSAEIFDPAGAGTFVPTTGPMNTGRMTHTATALAAGKVLISGGWNGSARLATAEVFDSSTGLFTATGNTMTIVRTDHAVAPLPLQNGKVLLVGGWGNTGIPTATAEVFDPALGGGAGLFSATGAMATVRAFHSATTLSDGKVLVVGGFDGNNIVASAEIYDPDPALGTFSATGAMTAVRRGHTATLLPDGKVLVVGGEESSNNPLASAEIYDPATGIFHATGSLAVPRRNHAATLLANGKVLVTGGHFSNDAADTLATTETYDPASGQFTNTGSMTRARANHAAMLLPSAKVLITGGFDGAGAVNTADLFTPQ